ncbi:MAG TPA: hypothetical protein VNY24_00495 [Candidatus Acidoferrales bacterium]|jgi:hypothetical protein|nr:hypothetical protein [Candidatus Acidoferrales bacterium]
MPPITDSTQQDPEAVRRAALLAALMGKPGLRGASAALGESQPATPGFQSTDMTPTAQPGQSAAANGDAQSGPQPARPINGARPAGTGAAPGGMTRSPSISDPEATNAATRPLPTFQSEEEWNKANPAPAHTPYQAPDLKHRLLMGLFAGMQEFGRPGEGAATVRDYLGNIQKNEDAESSYPDTSAAAQHQRYMTAAQGAEAPLHIQNLKALIDKNEADAQAKLHPQPKTQLVKIADPTGQDPHGIPALHNMVTGEITDQEGKAIPGAKLWQAPQKEERPFNLDEQELEARQSLRNAKTPEDRAAAQARIEDIRASRQRPPEERSPKESHLTPGQKATENRKYQKELDDIETERRARESGTYVHPRSGELMSPMTNDELFDRKQRAEDEYKNALEAAGETNVRRFNYRAGKYEGGDETPAEGKTAKPLNAKAAAKPNGNAAPAQHQVGDEVMYQGKPHRITAIQNGKATLEPIGK